MSHEFFAVATSVQRIANEHYFLKKSFMFFIIGFFISSPPEANVERSSDQGKEEEYLWCEVGGWGTTIPQLDKSTPRNWVSFYI